MRVLIADSLGSSAVSDLESFHCDVTLRSDLNADELADAIGGYQVLVVRSTKVSKATIDASDQLALIVRAGAGVNTIDLEAAAARGIYVANCPGKNADAVAELALGLIIAADRGIADATLDLRDGKWRKKHYQSATGLRGRRLGIIGYGSIGKALAQLARGLGMEVAAWSRSLSDEVAAVDGVLRVPDLLDCAKTCDVISVHLAAHADTESIIDSRFFDAIKPGAILVNTSRGSVVDEKAMMDAIESRQIKVGLDVFRQEPGSGTADFDNIVLAEKVTATPHIGASTAQASEAIAAETVRIIRTYKETGSPANVVNVNVSGHAPWILVVRHRNSVGVLAGVLDELRRDDINIEEMQNTIFSGGEAACCTMQLDSLPADSTLERIQSMEMIYAARIEETPPG